MNKSHGTFIVLEGSDGSGKTTQFEILKKRLIEAGYDIAVFSFPRYDQASSHFIKRYLAGEYGPASTISPYTASLFYALDRYEAAAEIRNALAEGKVVLCSRYVGANMAHQGAKFADATEKRSFFVWEDSLEFQLLNIPRPDINLFLRVPAEISQRLIKERSEKTGVGPDSHEKDTEFMQRSVATYDLLCELFPRDYLAIDCVSAGQLLSVASVTRKIWQQLEKYLPDAPGTKAVAVLDSSKTTEVLSTKTAEAKAYLDIDQLSLLGIYELKRLGFKLKPNFATCWSGQGTKYDFSTPEGLPKGVKDMYGSAYQKAAQNHLKVHSAVIERLAKAKLSRATLRAQARQQCTALIPLGAYFECRVTLEKEDVAEQLDKISTSPSAELRSLAAEIVKFIDSQWPDLLKVQLGAASQTSPEAIDKILQQLTLNTLPQTLSEPESLQLIEAAPRNEFELLADGMYPYTDLTHSEILSAIETWNYDQKVKTLRGAINANPELLNEALYKFNILSEQAALYKIMEVLPNNIYQHQPATVRYGYDVPGLIEELGYEDDYMQVFDAFLELFSTLQSETEAAPEIATLAGHKLKWQGRFSAADILKLSVSVDLGEIGRQLADEINSTHPVIAEMLANYNVAGSKAKSKGRKRR